MFWSVGGVLAEACTGPAADDGGAEAGGGAEADQSAVGGTVAVERGLGQQRQADLEGLVSRHHKLW